MRKIKLELPKYRLQLQYHLVKRRKPLLDEPLVPNVKIIKRKYKKGTILGRYLRHIFEHKYIQRFLSGNLAVMFMATTLIPTANVEASNFNDTETIQIENTLTTTKSVQFPLEQKKITQGYNTFHPGVDLDGITGDPVKSIKTGRVISVSHSKYAYGESVLIDHGGNLISLYAHLSSIDVEVGQEINMDTELGKVGATGKAFGDHLHLEVYQAGSAINPLTILP